MSLRTLLGSLPCALTQLAVSCCRYDAQEGFGSETRESVLLTNREQPCLPHIFLHMGISLLPLQHVCCIE
jgi:hypothetical protein